MNPENSRGTEITLKPCPFNLEGSETKFPLINFDAELNMCLPGDYGPVSGIPPNKLIDINSCKEQRGLKLCPRGLSINVNPKLSVEDE